jgi:hypothetical protein
MVNKMKLNKENQVLTIIRWLIEEGHIQIEGEMIKLP